MGKKILVKDSSIIANLANNMVGNPTTSTISTISSSQPMQTQILMSGGGGGGGVSGGGGATMRTTTYTTTPLQAGVPMNITTTQMSAGGQVIQGGQIIQNAQVVRPAGSTSTVTTITKTTNPGNKPV